MKLPKLLVVKSFLLSAGILFAGTVLLSCISERCVSAAHWIQISCFAIVAVIGSYYVRSRGKSLMIESIVSEGDSFLVEKAMRPRTEQFTELDVQTLYISIGRNSYGDPRHYLVDVYDYVSSFIEGRKYTQIKGRKFEIQPEPVGAPQAPRAHPGEAFFKTSPHG